MLFLFIPLDADDSGNTTLVFKYSAVSPDPANIVKPLQVEN
jgi:hypothetical protein